MTYDNHIIFIRRFGDSMEDFHTSSVPTYPQYKRGQELLASSVSSNFPRVDSVVVRDCLYANSDDLCTDPGDPCTDPNDLCARVLGNLLIIEEM